MTGDLPAYMDVQLYTHMDIMYTRMLAVVLRPRSIRTDLKAGLPIMQSVWFASDLSKLEPD